MASKAHELAACFEAEPCCWSGDDNSLTGEFEMQWGWRHGGVGRIAFCQVCGSFRDELIMAKGGIQRD